MSVVSLMGSMSPVTIMVVGKSGAGKSTLVNTLLDLRPGDPHYQEANNSPESVTTQIGSVTKVVQDDLDDHLHGTPFTVVSCLALL